MKPILSACLALPLLAGIAPPRVGVVLTRDGRIQMIQGVAGAFVRGDALETGAAAVQIAASATHTLTRAGITLRFDDQTFEVPDSAAALGFDDAGETGLAYLPSASTIVTINTRNGAARLPLDPALIAGEVLAVSGSVTLYVRRDDGIHALGFRPDDGALVSDRALNFDARLLAAASGFVFWTSGQSAGWLDTQGHTGTLDLPAPVETLHVMSSAWIYARTALGSLVFRLRDGALEQFQLPEESQ